MQNIGGVGPSGTHSPADIALIAFVSSCSKEFTISPFDLAMLVAAVKKYPYNLELRSDIFSGRSDARMLGKPGISRSESPISSFILS